MTMTRSYFTRNLSIAAVMLGATALSPAAMAQDAGRFDFFRQRFAQNVPSANSGTSATADQFRQHPVDPGVRGGTPGAGGPLSGLSQNELNFFNAAKDVFNEVDGVAQGLGPRFNLDGCGGCHAFPATGGSSPSTNPQVANATANGATNTVPSFITANGPIREARFVRNPDGTPDGGVHD